MHRRFKSRSLVSTIVLFSLSFPLPLLSITLGIEAVSAQAQTSQSRRDEALRLNKIGLEQLNRGQFREALETFEQALVIVREIGDRKDEGTILSNIGNVYHNLGQYPRALEYFSQALAIFKQVGNSSGEGTTLTGIGLVYDSLGQYPRALEYLSQALAIHKQVGDTAGEGTTLNNIGSVYRSLGQYPRALEYLSQALAIFKQVGDKPGEGSTLSNIGNIYLYLGQYPRALEYLSQALAIRKQVGDSSGEGTTLVGIGNVYFNLGQYPQALEYYRQALAIHKQVGDKAGEGTILNNIGNVYDSLGQYPRALEYFSQALAIRKQVGDKPGEGTTLNNIGNVYDNLGEYPRALEYYSQALAIHKQVGNRQMEGTTLTNIGNVYYNLGQYPRTLEYFSQALAIRKQVGDKPGEGATLNNIGYVYNSLGEYPRALEYFSQALAISKQVGNSLGEGATLKNIGYVYNSLGEYPRALEYLSQALAILKQLGHKAGEGSTLNNIGGVYNSLGQYADAEKTLFAAIEVRESLRARELPDAHKISLFEIHTDTYGFLQQSLVAQNKINTALEIAERGRARAFVELLASRLSDNPNSQLKVEKPTIAQIQKIASEQNATLVQYSIVYNELKVEGKTERRESELLIWVVKPTGEIAFKQVDLKSLNTTLEDVAERSRVFAATGREPAENTPIASTNNRTRQAISGLRVTQFNQDAADRQTQPIPKDTSPNKRLRQVYDLLIEPIADRLPTDPDARVIFIPQGALFRVPFPALIDKNGKYLIEKHTILTAPSIQILDLTRKQRRAGVSPAEATNVLVVGNPTMPLSLEDSSKRLDSLPYSLEEAKEIATFFNTQFLTGDKATKVAVKQQMEKARIIHLATHGLFDDKEGLQSAIALAPLGKDDGWLTADEILNLKLKAELVVLSACDTGRGEISGDGVIGLSRSLISAGASSVIVSLWPVWDDSTKLLMTKFYRHLQQNPDKAKALRGAMLEIMQQKRQPKHWAAFTLIGEAE